MHTALMLQTSNAIMIGYDTYLSGELESLVVFYCIYYGYESNKAGKTQIQRSNPVFLTRVAGLPSNQ